MGAASWNWPSAPQSKQKLVDFDHFDPQRQLFQKGAHMPLVIYIGAHSDTRRKPASILRRELMAEKRGWGKEARKAKGKASDGGTCTRGGGGCDKGKGQAFGGGGGGGWRADSTQGGR